MKSKKVKKLIKWLESKTRIIDLPRSLSITETENLSKIAETELSGDTEKLEKMIKDFKNCYNN